MAKKKQLPESRLVIYAARSSAGSLCLGSVVCLSIHPVYLTVLDRCRQGVTAGRQGEEPRWPWLYWSEAGKQASSLESFFLGLVACFLLLLLFYCFVVCHFGVFLHKTLGKPFLPSLLPQFLVEHPPCMRSCNVSDNGEHGVGKVPNLWTGKIRLSIDKSLQSVKEWSNRERK